jgi:hypothetical protein
MLALKDKIPAADQYYLKLAHQWLVDLEARVSWAAPPASAGMIGNRESPSGKLRSLPSDWQSRRDPPECLDSHVFGKFPSRMDLGRQVTNNPVFEALRNTSLDCWSGAWSPSCRPCRTSAAEEIR